MNSAAVHQKEESSTRASVPQKWVRLIIYLHADLVRTVVQGSRSEWNLLLILLICRFLWYCVADEGLAGWQWSSSWFCWWFLQDWGVQYHQKGVCHDCLVSLSLFWKIFHGAWFWLYRDELHFDLSRHVRGSPCYTAGSILANCHWLHTSLIDLLWKLAQKTRLDAPSNMGKFLCWLWSLVGAWIWFSSYFGRSSQNWR